MKQTHLLNIIRDNGACNKLTCSKCPLDLMQVFTEARTRCGIPLNPNTRNMRDQIKQLALDMYLTENFPIDKLVEVTL